MDYTVFGYFAALCILSGMLFGIAPALRSSKPDLNRGFSKESSHTVSRRRGGWLSGGLVIFQFALTLVLLTGAGIFVSGLFRGLTVNKFIPAKANNYGAPAVADPPVTKMLTRAGDLSISCCRGCAQFPVYRTQALRPMGRASVLRASRSRLSTCK